MTRDTGRGIWNNINKMRLIKRSTLAFMREGRRKPGYSCWDWLHGYVYGRWPYLYISIGTGEHRLAKVYASASREIRQMMDAVTEIELHDTQTDEVDVPKSGRGFAEGYHGKVMPLDSACRLVMVNEAIHIRDLEKVIPYERAREILLKNPDRILALECPCRSARANPCLPLDVCLVIGEPFASFVAEHHPRRARWISQEEAVQVLRAEDERGHVHHAFFKDAMLGRYYAICNCCACCCGAMQAHQRGTPMLASSGYVNEVNTDLCLGCGDCSEFCQFGALSINSHTAQVDHALCMGCGVCVTKCDQGALSLRLEASKGIPLEIAELIGSPRQTSLS